jgi:enoyl-CoA hydratase/carnithine racemase
MYEPFLAVLDIEVPVIAAMNGHAVGGGFGLALLCDIRLACRSAKYGANFCRLGLAPGLGISYLLPRLVGASRAAELLYTGRLITGEEAVACGLASRALEADAVLPAALELASEIATSAPLAVRATKRSMADGLGWDARRAAWREAFAQAATVATEDFQEGVAALLDKRAPRFSGS